MKWLGLDEAAAVLLEYKANPDKEASDGQSPLDVAVEKGELWPNILTIDEHFIETFIFFVGHQKIVDLIKKAKELAKGAGTS